MRRLLLSAVLVCAIGPAAGADGQEQADLSQYVHHTWRRAEGLPQDTVSAVVQTRDGYIWLGTQEGLARFDGVGFTLFNKGNTPAFSHNEVDALVEGADGTLWIGTFGGLLQWKDGRFVAHPTRTSRERDAVTCLALDRDGALWVGTQNGGLNRFRDGRYEFFSDADGLPSRQIESIAIDAAGDVWIGTPAGLSVRRNGRWRTFDEKNGLPATGVWQVLPSRDGAVWAGTNRGVARISRDVIDVPAWTSAVAHEIVRSVFEDRAGTLWAGTDSGVLWRLGPSRASSVAIGGGSAGTWVGAIAEDREGSIWAGTYVAGLHRFWRGRFNSLSRQDGLPVEGVRAILQARTGEIWLSSEGAGVSRFDGRGVTTFTTRDGLGHDVARALFEDSTGTLWAGTRDGLSRFEQGRFRTLPHTVGINVRALAEDPTGTLWVGTTTRGVFRLVDGRLTSLAADNRTTLPGGTVRTLVRDRQGAMWIGTNDALTRWRDGTATVYTSRDGLPADAIYCVHEDADGTLWLGSYGGGLVRMKQGRITRYRQADGLFDDVAFQILEDGQNNLWISCNNGVYRVSKAELDAFAAGSLARISAVAFNSADGMLSSECNGNTQPAGWKTADGRLWFPTTNGAVIIDPENLSPNTRPPLVTIESVAANRRQYPVTQDAVIAPGAGTIDFSYAGLSFIAPRKVRFRYRLDGLDAEWVDAGDRRQTSYSNLSPGRYVFRVMASNNDGVWSEADARFAFELLPRFHQTAWFRALAFLAAIGVVIGGYRMRLWRHLQRERELTARVDQALGRIKVLSGLIPICANCKKIRDDHGYWSQLEQYLRTHSEATFSHGICPDCMDRLYGDLARPTPGREPEPPGRPGA